MSQTDNQGRVDLPITAGPNLSQQWVSVTVIKGVEACKARIGQVSSSDNVTINGIPFLKEIGGDSGAGSTYYGTAYSTPKGSACISLTFVMKAANLGDFLTSPVCDQAAESAVFSIIMSTYTNR